MKKYRGITSWFTKVVEVKKVVEKIVDRPVPGEASRVALYEAYTTKRVCDYSVYLSAFYERHEHLGYYMSCAEAFRAHPGCQVRERIGIRIGGECFVASNLVHVTVTKPKRGKGKVRAAA